MCLERHINVDHSGHVHDIWLLKSFNKGFYLCGLWHLCNWICSILQHTCKHTIWHWLHSDLYGTKLPLSLKDGIFKSARLNFSFLGIGFWIRYYNFLFVCLIDPMIFIDLASFMKLPQTGLTYFVCGINKREKNQVEVPFSIKVFKRYPLASIIGGIKKVHLVVRSSV